MCQWAALEVPGQAATSRGGRFFTGGRGVATWTTEVISSCRSSWAQQSIRSWRCEPLCRVDSAGSRAMPWTIKIESAMKCIWNDCSPIWMSLRHPSLVFFFQDYHFDCYEICSIAPCKFLFKWLLNIFEPSCELNFTHIIPIIYPSFSQLFHWECGSFQVRAHQADSGRWRSPCATEVGQDAQLMMMMSIPIIIIKYHNMI